MVLITGAGIDCFIAGQQVGPRGTVVGVDMTPEMVHEARRLAKEHGHNNVSFRLGEIEYLPIADNYADVVISNCVVNLSPDKVRQQCHSTSSALALTPFYTSTGFVWQFSTLLTTHFYASNVCRAR